ncbi:MAG TPA: CocE/NonD family hydrolase [Polyangiaceae bacterium]|nr:CocE/NonD family hydrolase [Polyangiaceae bacterium]
MAIRRAPRRTRPSALSRHLLAAALAAPPLLAPALAAAAPAADAASVAAVPLAPAAPLAEPAPAAAAAATTGFRFVDIVAHDGVTLEANVIGPAAPGPHPAVVFVSSWGLNDLEYLAQASALAGRGYVVLSYTARGFWGSGGGIDTAGPLDVADVSTALDWAIEHADADPDRLGCAGVSYGAGIGLLASAFDPRVRAVVALSGWTDLAASLLGDDTRRPQAAFLLAFAGELLGNPSAGLTDTLGKYFGNHHLDDVVAYGRARSAATYVDAINANGPAILMANAYGDSLFGPNQLVDFYGQLAVPKRLELAPGDHAVVELTGLLGLPNHVWDSATRWLDRYVAGLDSGIDGEAPVVLRPRGAGGGAPESYADWADVTGSTQRLGLRAIRWWDGTGALGGAPDAGWSRTIWPGLDTVAGAGVVLLSNGLEPLTGTPPTAWLPAVDRLRAGVWLGEPLAAGAALRGTPRLHLTVEPSAAAGTVVAYLYDVDAFGTGALVAHAPVTWLAATPGQPLALDLRLPAAAYNVPAGHRFGLVVDTEDDLYFEANPFASSLDFVGQSWLDLPLR